MNFEDVRVIWDSQKSTPAFSIDHERVLTIVDKQSKEIHRDLKMLEVTAIAVLFGLGVATLIDTFFNGEEYFQLFSVAFEFTAAAFLWWRRRIRHSDAAAEPKNLIQQIESAIGQVRITMQRGRDMAIVFSLFVVYGVVIRVLIYGWQGSEIKALAAIVCVVMLAFGMQLASTRTHQPRLKSLNSLRQKLIDAGQTHQGNYV